MTVRPGPAVRDALTYRAARVEELEACAEIWRLATNDYLVRLNQPELLTDNAAILRLYGHLLTTDPERFIVATRADAEVDAGERVVAFAVALVRERLWFLSMCFVLPEIQGGGVARRMLEYIAPDDDEATVRATGTDSAQPISNALYASLGIVPRVPLLNLIGLPADDDAFGSLPSGVRATPFDRVAGEDHGRLVTIVDELDSETLGVRHPIDHRYLRQESRRGWLYSGPDGSPLAYGYATEAGRLGPIASRDPDLVAPILGHLTTAVTPRGAFAVWLPGTADRAVMGALRTGFRLEPFPVLLCWDRPFADFTRYLPISPGLL
ncbi:MAG TPA: GNAT family N-acetyltransferase [Candidatus Limnocylindrales bacterium]|nr:GNAT family N-acetyltransferase [Candidatus Limnocylindrales bacterium]